jgi:hypothetical protein
LIYNKHENQNPNGVQVVGDSGFILGKEVRVTMSRCLKMLLATLALLPLLGWATDESMCPKEFPRFLPRFESDIKYQVASVKFPLLVAYLETSGHSDPIRKTESIFRAAYLKSKHPYYPTPAIQANRRLERKIEDRSSSMKVVRFDQPDSDAYSVEYHFKKEGGCWRLTFMEDFSL